MPDRLRDELDHPLNEPVNPPAASEELSTRSEKKYPLSQYLLRRKTLSIPFTSWTVSTVPMAV